MTTWTDDRLGERLDRIDERFVGVDRRFEQVDKRFDRMDDRFDALILRFDSLQHLLIRLAGAGFVSLFVVLVTLVGVRFA